MAVNAAVGMVAVEATEHCEHSGCGNEATSCLLHCLFAAQDTKTDIVVPVMTTLIATIAVFFVVMYERGLTQRAPLFCEIPYRDPLRLLTVVKRE